MQSFIKVVRENEDWLTKRILKYAVERGYSKYGPPLEEVWSLAIRGLSESMLSEYERDNRPPEFNPDDDLTNDPVNKFAIEQARQHRKRGATLGMFLGLLKYFRQCYYDLVEEFCDASCKEKALKYITRTFDRYEIGFCSEWSNVSSEKQLLELQSNNRKIINEKNAYLTVFESITDPVILLNKNFDIVNLNYAASQLISKEIKKKYLFPDKLNKDNEENNDSNKTTISKNLFKIFPWLLELENISRSEKFVKHTLEASVTIDDTQYHHEVILSKMLDVSEKYTDYILTIRDITEHKNYENSLKQKSLLVEALHDSIVITGLDGKIKEWNAGSEKIFGYTKEQVLGKPLDQFSKNKQTIELNKKVIKQIIEEGYWKDEVAFTRVDGQRVYLESMAVRLLNDKNEIEGILGIHRDVTQLKKSELELYSIIENSESSIWLINSDYELIKFNSKFKEECKERFNIELKANLHMVEAFRVAVPINADQWKTRYDKALSGATFSVVDEFNRINGSVEYIKFKFTPIKEEEKIVGVSVFSETITEQRLAEQALRESEEQYRNLFETMAQGVVYQDEEGKITKVNPAAERILGLSFDQMAGRTSLDPRWHTIHFDGTAFPGNEHPAMVSLKTGQKISNVKMGIYNVTEDNYRWANVSSVPQFKNDEAKPYQVYATIEDITNTFIAEKKLKESEEKFRALFENMNEGFALHKIIFNDKGEPVDYMFIDVNPAFEMMTSIKREEIQNKLVTEVFPGIENDKANWINRYAKVALNGKPELFDDFTDQINKWFLVNAFSPKKGYFATIFSDITERKLAEEKLKKFADTQETLLREVNHRVKNNLAALLGILHKEEERAMVLGVEQITPIIKDISNRVQGLSTVHTMLSASGWRPLILEQLCQKVISGTIKSLEQHRKVKIYISNSEVTINSTQAHHLTLVLNELATNSVKHIDNPLAALAISVEIEQNNKEIVLIYKDNGPGYPQEIINGDYSNSNIGFQLIHGISTQSLAGKVEFFNDMGAAARISFYSEDF